MADTNSIEIHQESKDSHDSIGDDIQIEEGDSRGRNTDAESNSSWYHHEFLDITAARKFWKVAGELTGSLWEQHFKSFEVLNLALILRSQQQLILMNRKILESDGELLARDDVVLEARKALRDYYNDLQRLRELHGLRVVCPGKPHGHPNEPEGHPNRELWREPTAYLPNGGKTWNQYLDSDVAYLSPEPDQVRSDGVRWWLHHLWNKDWLDDVGLQQRLQYAQLAKEYMEVITTDSRWQRWSFSLFHDWKKLLRCVWFRLVLMPLDRTASLDDRHSWRLIRPHDSQLQALRHQIRVLGNRFHVSQSVDLWSRWVIAMIGAVIINVPLVALTSIPSEAWTQLTVVLFTLAFASTAAFFSRASNQEILAAIAGYVAVLVVFISDHGPN